MENNDSFNIKLTYVNDNVIQIREKKLYIDEVKEIRIMFENFEIFYCNCLIY